MVNLDGLVMNLELRRKGQPITTELAGSGLLCEIRTLGYQGSKTILNDYLQQIRLAPVAGFKVRLEIRDGAQTPVDFAEFKVRYCREGGRVP